MASFPDLRPHRRSAKAERKAASKNRTRLLLVVSAALLFTAYLAVSELATPRGKKAHDASAFLTRELGPPLDSNALVRTPAHKSTSFVKPALGGKLEIRNGGLKVTSGKSSVSLRYGTARGSWRGHQHGVQRRLPFGSETIVLGTNRVEQSLIVGKRQGTRTWRWRLDAGNLEARVTANGAVRFSNGTKDAGLRILPVVIFDKNLKDVTPDGLRWSLAGHGKNRSLQLRLNDANLPLPYVIDPIALVAACPGGGCATGNNNASPVTVTRPASVDNRQPDGRAGHDPQQRCDYRSGRLDDDRQPAHVGREPRAEDLLPHRHRRRHRGNDVQLVVYERKRRRLRPFWRTPAWMQPTRSTSLRPTMREAARLRPRPV